MERIILIGIMLPLVFAQVEELDEMFSRKDRMDTADWPVDVLENASTYIWQPETLMYHDVQTGNEVWRLTNSKGASNFYHNDIVLNPWSADGKRLSFSSVRPTQAYNNYDDWAGVYKRIWFITDSDGSNMRTPANTPKRTVGSYPLFWSQQIPDTYYQMGDAHYLESTGTPGTLYEVTVQDNDVQRTALLDFSLSGTGDVGTNIYVASISPDSKKVIVIDRNGGSERYSSVAIMPAVVYPDPEVLVPLGYPYFRDTSMSDYVNTPSFYDHAHAGIYRLLGPSGEWFATAPSGGSIQWIYKTVGTASDGGPLYTDDLLLPVDQPPYDFGEVKPLYGTTPNPFNAPYMSHSSPSMWGDYVLHSCCCVTECYDPGIGPGIWDIQNHGFVVATFGGGAQHHDWHGFTDWTASTRGAGDETGCLAQGYARDEFYQNDRLYTQKYDDPNSQKTLCYTHNLYNNDGCYEGASYEYSSVPRPAQSPDGTKIAFHSTFLNIKTGDYDSSPDIYWTVAYYPYPPTDLSARFESGARIEWLPPQYTERGWPTVTDPAPYAREIVQYHVWRSSGQNGPWEEIGRVDAEYDVDDYFGLMQSTDNLFFNIVEGAYYYAVTSEEYSGLESDMLSEIIEVTVNGNFVSGQVVQPQGQRNFWTQSPAPVVDFQPNGQTLKWIEPSDNKIRYYNIYYGQNTLPVQEQRIASVPVGTTLYFDWLGEGRNYGITSVDRYGNEGDIVTTSCGIGDTDCSGDISLTELIAYVDTWKNGFSTITDLMQVISIWKG